MRTQILCAALACAGIIAGSIVNAAYADHVDDRNFSDRDGETEFYVCLTENGRNNRLVYNRLDRNFCNDVLRGHVEFMHSPEIGAALSRSQILCYQRSRRCMAPEEQAAGQ